LPQEDRYEDYDAFKFSLHCGLLVLPALISSLLLVFPQPFEYTSLLKSNAGPGSGEGEQHMNCALDLPLNVVAQRRPAHCCTRNHCFWMGITAY
jgi:hypothetical protein